MSHFWAGFIVSLMAAIVSTLPDLLRGATFFRHALNFIEWLPTTFILAFLGGVVGEFLLSEQRNYGGDVAATIFCAIVTFGIAVISSRKLLFLEMLWDSSSIKWAHVVSTVFYCVSISVSAFPFFYSSHLTGLNFSADWPSTVFGMSVLTLIFAVLWRLSIYAEARFLKPKVEFLFRRACSQSVLDLSDPLMLLNEERESFKALIGGLEKRRTFVSNVRPSSFCSRQPQIYNVTIIPVRDFQKIVEDVQRTLLEEMEIWSRMFAALDGGVAEAEEAFTVLHRHFCCEDLERIALCRFQLQACEALQRAVVLYKREEESSIRRP